MNEEQKKQFIERLKKDREEAYLRNMEAKKKRKGIHILDQHIIRMGETICDKKSLVEDVEDPNMTKKGTISEEVNISTENITENEYISCKKDLVVLVEKNPNLFENEILPSSKKLKIKIQENNLVAKEQLLKGVKKSSHKRKSDSTVNYNTKKSRWRRARLSEEQKAIVREKDKLRKKKAREEGKILGIGKMSKIGKSKQRKTWRETKRAWRQKKRNLKNVLNETPPTSDSEENGDLQISVDQVPLTFNENKNTSDRPQNVIENSDLNRYDLREKVVKVEESRCFFPASTSNIPASNTSTPNSWVLSSGSINSDKGSKLYQKSNAQKRRRNKLKQMYRQIEELKQRIGKRDNEIKGLIKDKLKYKKRWERQSTKNRLTSVNKIAIKNNQENFITPNPTARLEAQDGNMISPNTKVKNMLHGRAVPVDVKKQLVFGMAFQDQILGNMRQISEKDNESKQVAKKILSGNLLCKYKMHNKIKTILSYKDNTKYCNRETKFKYERRKRPMSVPESTRCRIKDFFESDRVSRMCPGKANFITRKKSKKQKRLLQDSLISCLKKFKHENPLISISFSTFYQNKPFWVVQPSNKDRETCACVKHENFKYILAKMLHESLIDHQNLEKITENDFIIDLKQENIEEKIRLCQWKSKQEERTLKNTVKKIRITSKEALEMTKNELVKMFWQELPAFKTHFKTMNNQMDYMEKIKKSIGKHEIAVHIDFAENYNAKLSREIQSMHFGANKKQISIHTGIAYLTNNLGEKNTISFATISDNLDHQAHSIWCHMKPVLDLLCEKCNPTLITKVYFFSDGPTSQYRNKYNIHSAAKHLQQAFPNADVSWNYSASGHGKGPMDGIGGTLKRMADECVFRGGDITCANDFLNLVKPKCQKTDLFEIKSKAIQDEKEKMKDVFPVIPKITQVHQITWGKFSSEVDIHSRILSCDLCRFDVECKHFPVNKVSSIQTNDKPQTSTEIVDVSNVPSIGRWVAVIYDEYWYPGMITDIEDNDLLTIKFLQRHGKSYKWPTTDDIQKVNAKEILYVLRSPPKSVSIRRTDLFLIPEEEEINNLFDACFV